eukprot:IDg8305t1
MSNALHFRQRRLVRICVPTVSSQSARSSYIQHTLCHSLPQQHLLLSITTASGHPLYYTTVRATLRESGQYSRVAACLREVEYSERTGKYRKFCACTVDVLRLISAAIFLADVSDLPQLEALDKTNSLMYQNVGRHKLVANQVLQTRGDANEKLALEH